MNAADALRYTCFKQVCVQVTSSRLGPTGVLVFGSRLTSVTCDDPELARPAEKSRKNITANKVSQGLV